MSGTAALAAFAIAVPALLVAFAVTSAEPPGPAQDRGSAPGTATAQASAATTPVAPDFTRKDLRGRALRLSDFRGKVVLLNFWATWCEPCLAEIETFSRWQRQHGADGLQVVGVSMDDDPAVVVAAVNKYQIAYPIVMGDEQLGSLYGGVLGLPLSFLVDPSGRLVARYQGEPKLAKLEAQLKTLLPHWQH